VAACPLIQGRNQDIHVGWFPCQQSAMPRVVVLIASMAEPHCRVCWPDSFLWPLAWHHVVWEVWLDINCSIWAASQSKQSSSCLFSILICDTCLVSCEIAELYEMTVVASVSFIFCCSSCMVCIKCLFNVGFKVLFFGLLLSLLLKPNHPATHHQLGHAYILGWGLQLQPPNVNHQSHIRQI